MARHVNRPQNTLTKRQRRLKIKNQVIPKDNIDPLEAIMK